MENASYEVDKMVERMREAINKNNMTPEFIFGVMIRFVTFHIPSFSYGGESMEELAGLVKKQIRNKPLEFRRDNYIKADIILKGYDLVIERRAREEFFGS